MKMTNDEYNEYVKKKAPKSPLWLDVLKAFVSGGVICCIGQGIMDFWSGVARLSQEDAGTATTVTLIFLGALLTGLGVYDNIAKFAGAGSLVPVTGFANSVVSPALEFKSEGFITGMSAKIFTIAGPVITFGVIASVLYGIILVLCGA